MAEVGKKPTVSVLEEKRDVEKQEIHEEEFTEEETATQIRVNEEDFIQGLIAASGSADDESERQRIEIVRNKKLLFAFHIRPLGSEEYDNCRREWTKYVRNKQLGMKMPEDTDRIKYQSAIIYQATIKEDRDNLWDNKEVWKALRDKKIQIMSGLDVIEYTLKAGEKDRILEAIDTLSGYDSDLEEVAKN